MAGPAVIGALRVVLGADTAQFEDGLKKASNGLSGFLKRAGEVAAGVTFARAIEGMTSALVGWVKHAIVGTDKMGELAQSIGIPIEELSALQVAAKTSGLSLEQLGNGVVRLSRSMAESVAKPTGEAADAFRALGVSVANSDGSLRTSQDVMEQIADRFEKMQDGAGKTALAVKIFGRSGAELIPLLNEGGASLRRMSDEAASFGIVIDEHARAAADRFMDNLEKLGLVKDGLVLKITEALLPSLEALTESMLNASVEARGFEAIQLRLPAIMDNIITTTMKVIAVFRAFGNSLVSVKDAAAQLASGNLAQAQADLASGWERTKKIIFDTGAAIDDFNAKSAQIPIGQSRAGVIADSIKDKLPAPHLGGAEAARKHREELDKLLASQRESAAHLAEEALPPLVRYQQELINLQAALAGTANAQEVFAFHAEKAAERYGLSWKKQVPDMLGAFAEVASGFGKENAKMAKAAKILGAAQALIATLVGAAEAYKLGPIAGIAASALILAKGLALVAAIKAEPVPGFATGGSFKVGGSGGLDSQMVQFRATPGEMVDVSRPGDNRRGVVNVTLEGSNFSVSSIRDLFATLNDAMRDGYQLKVNPA